MGQKSLNKLISAVKASSLKYKQTENDNGDDSIIIKDCTIDVCGNTYYVYVGCNCEDTDDPSEALKIVSNYLDENK